jgi:UDP-N-acetylmuramoylalanine--D-glutamate ligase
VIPVTTFAGKRVAVFGLGSSGMATLRALRAGGAVGVASDDKKNSIEQAAAEGFQIGDLRQADWSAFSALVLAPGVPLTHPAPHWTVERARSAGVEVIGDIELYCRERRTAASAGPFVAITGTNGKSTTTALTAHLFKTAGYASEAGGNLGTPILAFEPPDARRAHVVECSSFQIDLAPTLDPFVGVLLNVTEDHLDRHGTLGHYAAVKERLVAGIPPAGTAVVGVDDEICAAIAEKLIASGKRVERVSVTRALQDGYYVEQSAILHAAAGKVRRIASIADVGSLRGSHNAQNAACAAAIGIAFGIEPETIQRALRTFPGLAHRMEEVARLGRVLFVNDSKATNADAAARALSSFENIFWIAGGKAKTGGITSLASFFPRIRKAYLIGEAAEEFGSTLRGQVSTEMAVTLDRAVAMAARDATASGLAEPVVLLSPACASYDQFPNFEVRGAAFRTAVEALSATEFQAG